MIYFLSGGGTGGSVSPLIALYQELKKNDPNAVFYWVGTYNGVEKTILEKYQDIHYIAISSGKLRRYFSWQNFIDPFKILWGFFQSFYYLKKYKADYILTAGSFVSVPLVWASKFLTVKVLVHQQDVSMGLANKLMLWSADIFNITLKKIKYKINKKIQITYFGNFIRQEIFQADKNLILDKYGLDKNKDIVVLLGGGTGALNLNKFVNQNISKFLKENPNVQFVHLTGKGKNLRPLTWHENHQYLVIDFLNSAEIASLFHNAKLVITRAGLSTLSELSVLGKNVIIIPMPNSHQEENANYWKKEKSAIVVKEDNLNELFELITELFTDKKLQEELSQNIKNIMPANGAELMANYLLSQK